MTTGPRVTNDQLLERSWQRARDLAAHDVEIRTAMPSEEALARLRDSASCLEALEQACQCYATRPCLSGLHRLTFAELWQRVEALAAGLLSEDLATPGDRVGIWGAPGVDWVVADLACLRANLVSVPLNHGAVTTDLVGIVRETAVRCLVCSAEHLATLDALLPSCPSVEHVVVMDRGSDAGAEHHDGHADVPHGVRPIEDVERRGRARTDSLPAVARGPHAPDALRTLVYTSGTGGHPKGVMFPERVWLEYWRDPARGAIPPLPGVRLASLPLSHIAGRRQLLYSLVTGGVTHFMSSSDMSTFVADVRRVRPTLMMLVPRVSGLVYKHFLAERLRRPGEERAIIADMRDSFLGDRLLLLITGSAPTPPEVTAFLSDCFAVPVVRGYATTEAGVLTFDERPVENLQSFRLADVPALGYHTTDTPYPRGELLVRTRAMAPGYYRNLDASRDLFDADGYMRTHDIVEQRSPDELVWLDRVHDVVKLAQGEFVEVSRLESLFAAGSPFIHQIYIHADSRRAELAAVVVPELAAVRGLVGTAAGADAAVRTLVIDEITRIAEAARLRPYEIPRDCLIEMEPFTAERGLLTESGKLARRHLRAAYGGRFDTAPVEPTAASQTRVEGAGIGLEVREVIRPLLDPRWRSHALPDDLTLGPHGLGLDSMTLVEMLLACESRFGVTLDVESLTGSPALEPTLGRVVALITRRREEQTRSDSAS